MQGPRRDAARNYAELLSAAETVIAAHGVDVSMSVIAKAAGVGQGTLYRHFGDRRALLLALIGRSLDRIDTFVEVEGGANTLFRFLRFFAGHVREYAALADYWRVIDKADPALMAARKRFDALVEPMLQRAIDAQLCRPDLTVMDVRSLISMLNSVPSGGSDANAWSSLDRALDLVVSGIQRR